MEKILVELDAIFGDKMQNEFMHAMGVLEPSKQLGTHQGIAFEGMPKQELTGEDLAEALTAIHQSVVNTLEEKANLVFVAIRTVNGTRMTNPPVFIMPNVSAISDGHRWGLLKDALEYLDYVATTNDRMQVLTVTH